MKLLARIAAGIVFILWGAAGLVLFFYYWEVLTTWLGAILGTLVAFVVSPGVFVFPFVYWIVQRTFPIFYFELLGVCAGCTIIFGLLLLASGDLN
jgi:hypothetical protein